MPRRSDLAAVAVVCFLSFFWLSSLASASVTKTFTIREPFGLSWDADRVNYPVEFDQGQVAPNGGALKDEQGRPVAVQFSDVTLWPDHTVQKATLSFMASLHADQVATWTLTARVDPVNQPATDLSATENTGQIELANQKAGIRIVGGEKTFPSAVTADQIPAPIQGVRLQDGTWLGKGWWQTDIKCVGYSSKIVERGPVFVRVQMRYDFEGGKYYAATVELNANRELAVVQEKYNLSEGRKYHMSGLTGMTPDQEYSFVYPRFASPDRALIWDWWGGCGSSLPTPNCYCFSFYQGFQPDSVAFTGYNKYQHIYTGDSSLHMGGTVTEQHGALRYNEDDIFAYLNAVPQWGDQESHFLGFYNSKHPAVMLAVIGLHASEWQHPDIDPHPDKLINQYVQSTCIRFEQRKDGDVLFRAPADLGQRVYGIGGVQQVLGHHTSIDYVHFRDFTAQTPETWSAELAKYHVRYGILTLDRLKDWILDYKETSPDPCAYVTPGDLASYISRKTRKPVDEVRAELASETAPTLDEKKVVADALDRSRMLLQSFVQENVDVMYMGIEDGNLALLDEDALASRACTPAQAQELRRYLAGIAYCSLDPDYMPPRTSGFAWGAANQGSNLQCRTCNIVALLPHHPMASQWRQKLAKIVSLYFNDEVNTSGVTLENPHYGELAIVMPVLSMAALASSASDIDLGDFEQRLRAVAHERQGTLLPWDVRGNMRSMTPEGDGTYSPEGVFGLLAAYFEKRDPHLASEMAWDMQESGNAVSSDISPMLDVGIPAIQPEVTSEYYPGYGTVMRNGFPSHNEDYVQVMGDSFCYGHTHPDKATWIMYAKGAPLMMHFGAQYMPSFHETWVHPGGLTFDHDETIRDPKTDGSDDWWRKCADANLRESTKAPFTNVQIVQSPTSNADIDRLGEISAFKSTPQADYTEYKRNVSVLDRICYMLKDVHGKDYFNDSSATQEIDLKHPFLWTRRFLFMKDADPLGHNYLVMRDDLPGNQELDPDLTLWCLASDLKVDGQTALYTGQYGVNLMCYVANPTSFMPKTRTLGHDFGPGFAAYFQKTFHKKFREDQIELQIPQSARGSGYFVVMVPLKGDEPAPKFETLANGNAVRVTFPDRTDTIVLQDPRSSVTLDGQTITTPSAAIIQRGKQQTVVDLSTKEQQ